LALRKEPERWNRTLHLWNERVDMVKKILVITVCALFVLVSSNLFAAASPLGLWKTIDDATGKPKSVVSIWNDNGKLYGKILLLMEKPQDSLCKKCEGSDHMKPVVGMVFLNGFHEEDGKWTGGTVLDPESGKVYRGKIWCEGVDRLKLRGYVLVFWRTQTWQRIDETEKANLFRQKGVPLK
jgi:uncharacterized protein (DUF2147 family)